MTYAEITKLMPGRRRKLKAAPVIAKSRETLKLSCSICGSRMHNKTQCLLAIDDGRGGVS